MKKHQYRSFEEYEDTLAQATAPRVVEKLLRHAKGDGHDIFALAEQVRNKPKPEYKKTPCQVSLPPDRAKDEQMPNISVPALIIPDGRAEIKEKIMDGKMISIHELSELWSVSPSLIRRLIARRENGLRAYKIGGKICIKVADAQTYLAANEIQAPEPPRSYGCQRFTYRPGMKVVSM